jgi:GNAT superfamily N-acetyltransferase
MNHTAILEHLGLVVAHPQRGAAVVLRAAVPTDLTLVTDLLRRLSDDSWYLRYLSPRPRAANAVHNEAQRLVRDQTWLHTTLIAMVEHQGREDAVAVAELRRDPLMPNVGDVAIAVRDDVQHNGIGSLLFQRLMQLARLTGIAALRAELFAGNHRAKRLLRSVTFPHTTTLQDGVLQLFVHLPLPTPTADAEWDLAAQVELAA